MTATAAQFCCGRRVITARGPDGTRVLNWPHDPQGGVQAQQTAAGGWQWASCPPGEAPVFPYKRYALHQCPEPSIH